MTLFFLVNVMAARVHFMHTMQNNSFDQKLGLENQPCHESVFPAPPNAPTTVPLSSVVAKCVKTWFRDTKQAAESGDPEMQCLLGQMLCLGYGGYQDLDKAEFWLLKSGMSKSDARRYMKSLISVETVNASKSEDLA